MFAKKFVNFAVMLTAFSWSLTLPPAFAYKTVGGEIYDNQNNKIAIDGVAWMGFQDSNFLNELWNVGFYPMGSNHGVMEILLAPWTVPESNVSSADHGVSFKSIRLPIQPGIWHNVASVQNNPFDFTKTDVNNPEAGNGVFCDWSAGSDGSGKCKKTKSAVELLNTTINEFNKNNVLVMLDFHHRPGLGDGFRDGSVVAADYSLKNYYDDVANFAKTAPANVFGIDIYNEPHKLYWYQDNTNSSVTQPAWIKVIAAAASATYENNQDILLFVEGPGGTVGNDPYDPTHNSSKPICESNSLVVNDSSVIAVTNDTQNCKTSDFNKRITNIGVNWGENFRALIDTNKSATGEKAFDVVTFRSMLIQSIETNNFSSTDPQEIADWLLGANNDGNNAHIVFAPHLYGAKVAGWQSDPHDSITRFDWNFGFLKYSGFATVIGEIGYDVQEPAKGGQDFFVRSLAPYLIERGMNHDMFFWTFNFIGDPKGMRASSSNLSLYDWKEQDLHDLFAANQPPAVSGTLCVTVSAPAAYTGTQLPVIKAVAGSNSYTITPSAFDSQTCISDITVGTYTLSGSALANSNGVTFSAKEQTATVNENATTDAVVVYTKQPSGTLQVKIAATEKCPISDSQSFVVSYSNGSTINSNFTIVGPKLHTVTVPVGDYTISVNPDSISNNCVAEYDKSAKVWANTKTWRKIEYVYKEVSDCSVRASCSTWGQVEDSWAGSSCNFVIDSKDSLTKPTTLAMSVTGITSITSVWNATGDFTDGVVTLELNNPQYTKNAGFNASGVISLPANATLKSNNQSYICPVVTQ